MRMWCRKGDRLRTMDERKPCSTSGAAKLGGRQIDDISRTDITRLLDRIASESGAPMADHTLAYLRRVMTWHASRSDTFRSPIVRGWPAPAPASGAGSGY